MATSELTPELIADLVSIEGVELSRNGRIAYVLEPDSKHEEHSSSSIWVAPLNPADGEARQFTSGDTQDSRPRWSPDGQHLAFLSDRKERGTAQLYLMPATGGEARACMQGKRAVEDFAWSPAGDEIAFTSADEPTEEDDRREKERDDPHVFGERWKYSRLRVVERESGEPRALVSGDRHVGKFCWSPDGRSLACVLRETPELDAQFGAGTIVEVATNGEERELCSLQGYVSDLLYSPDGKWLLMGRSADGYAQASASIWRMAASGGEPERLAGGVSNCVLGLRESADRSRIFCFVAEALSFWLGWLDPNDGALDSFYAPGEGAFWEGAARPTDTGAQVAVGLSLPNCPIELYAGEVPGDLQRLTDHNRQLADITLGAQEEFRWIAEDGIELDGLLIRPPGPIGTGPLPTIVLVHGGPYGRWSNGFHLSFGDWAQWLATAGYAVLMPNPRGGFGRGEQFAAAARGDVGGTDWQDVLAAVQAAIERGVANPDRLGIGGWSQGGFMTAWAVTQTDRFKAGVDGAGPTDWGWMAATSDMGSFEAELGGSVPWDGVGPHRHAQLSPLSFARAVSTPLLILHGENDARVPVSQATSLHRALREVGARVELVVYPREPHGIGERNHQTDLLRRVRDWFKQYV